MERRRHIYATAGAALLCAAVHFFGSSPAARAETAPTAPPGFDVVEHEALAPGVTHTALRRADPPLVVHVAEIAPSASASIRAVLSNNAVAGPGPRLERTTSMCARLRCVLAINGDFALPGADEPLGATVVDGQLARSPSPAHHQFTIDGAGRPSAGALAWQGLLMPTDLHGITIDGVNVGRGDNQLILYTALYGPSTATNPHGVELPVDLVDPSPPLRIGQTARVYLGVPRQAGDTPIPPTRAVLSAHGTKAAALSELWAKVEAGAVARDALLRIDAPAAQSVGGAPILVRNGKRFVAASNDNFVSAPHPRTVAGWRADGTMLLVTVDGRQPDHSTGLSLPDTADLLIALGAVEAINLDGGGSTTFVVGGAVRNQPSDRLVRRDDRETVVHAPGPGDTPLGAVERPVVSALVVVAGDGAAAAARGPGRSPRIDVIPLPAGLPASTLDPASNPELALPALLQAPDAEQLPGGVAVLALALLLGVGRAAARAWNNHADASARPGRDPRS